MHRSRFPSFFLDCVIANGLAWWTGFLDTNSNVGKWDMTDLQSAHMWFLVLFGLGGIISAAGFLLPAYVGALNWSNREHRIMTYWGIAVYLSHLLVLGYMQFVAVNF